MHVMSWVGVALIVCWAVLWFSVKIAVAAVHLILLLGLVFVVWGLFKGASARS